MRFVAGGTVRIRYDGNACGSFGVPKYQHGHKAKVLKVGRTRLKVLIEGDAAPREISMTSATVVRG